MRSPRFALPLLALLLTASAAQAAPRSRYADHWYFGGNCAISWDANVQRTLGTTPFQLNHSEGTSTWSDPVTGAVLISSNGIDAWDAGGAKINATNLGGDSSLAQTAVVPWPGHANQFYVLAMATQAAGSRMATLFDLSLPTAIKQVGVATAIPNTNASSEAMTTVFSPDGRTVWIISARATTRDVLVTPLTAAGIGATVVHNFPALPNAIDAGWTFIASSNGRQLAFMGSSNNDNRQIILFDFNPATGVPSAPTPVSPYGDSVTAGGLYGGAFSPDGKKLYYHLHLSTPVNALMQLDLATKVVRRVGSGPSNEWSGLSLAPDGRIYLAGMQVDNPSNLTVIDNPNAAAAEVVTTSLQVPCIVRRGTNYAPLNGNAGNTIDTDGDGIADAGDADADGDGIPNDEELGGDFAGDANGNGIPDYEDAALQNCADVNADGVCDQIPGRFDIDGDGIPNHLDTDADGDGVPDIVENGNGALDLDGDGRIDVQIDLDGDGLAAVVDANDADPNNVGTLMPVIDTDNDGAPDYRDLDSDGDCVPDSDPREAGAARTDRDVPTVGGECALVDTDGDGVPDIDDADADGDGIPNIVELGGDDVAGDKNNNGIPDYKDAAIVECTDANNDGICDTIPPKYDTDGDGIPNHLDLDSDGDGVFDIVENGHGDWDTDGDGRIDIGLIVDVDGDGLPSLVDADDNDANNVGLLTPVIDTDGDGVPDYLDTDSDGDCIPDNQETAAGRIDANDPVMGGSCQPGSSSSSSGSSGTSSSSGSSGTSGGSSGSSTSSSSGSSGKGTSGGTSGSSGSDDDDGLFGVESLTGGACSAAPGSAGENAALTMLASTALATALLRRRRRHG